MPDPSSSSSQDRRFIEESFPVKEVGEASTREKNIRHGHISTLYIWWARRPLAASRATAYAALVPPPKDIEEWQRQRDFIIQLCQWENSNNQLLLEKARRDILEAHAERLSQELGEKITVEDIEAGRAPRPRVLDPFAGGGSYPLEALRLGCEAYANDYNPVAVLIEKATLEYPQKFGRPFEGMPEWAYPNYHAPMQTPEDKFAPANQSSPADKSVGYEATPDESGSPDESGGYSPIHGATPRSSEIDLGASGVAKSTQLPLFDHPTANHQHSFNPLLNAVRYWGNWVLEEARKELAEFYPPDPDGSVPVGYIWARTIPCQNPACGQEIPLLRQFWLAQKDKKKVALYPNTSNGNLVFQIVGNGYESWPEGYDPEKGTVSNAIVTCLLCGAVVDADTIHRLFWDGRGGDKLVAIVSTEINKQGKSYRVATTLDEQTYFQSRTTLKEKRQKLIEQWGIDPVPDEIIYTPNGKEYEPDGLTWKFTPVMLYGLTRWGHLFNSRQLLAFISLSELVRKAYDEMCSTNYLPDFAVAVTTYLAFIVSRLPDTNSTLCHWDGGWEKTATTFTRQALSMSWDYIEANIFGDKGYNIKRQYRITCY